jgi:hypothetical protein
MMVNPNSNELRKGTRKVDTLCVIIEDYSTFAVLCTSENKNSKSQVKVRLKKINEFSEKFEDYQTQF